MPSPVLSICIPVKNRSLVYEGGRRLTLLPNLINSIRRATWKGDALEIIVADHYSDDWPLDRWIGALAHPIPVRVLQLEGAFSVGRAWNLAAEAAKAPWIWFLDADMLVNRGVMGRGVAAVRQDKAHFPICWSFLNPQHTQGKWRPTGCGNAIMTMQHWRQFGPRPEFTTHGKSDECILKTMHRAGVVVRERCPGFYHQWHPNTLPWLNRFYAHEFNSEEERAKDRVKESI